MMIESRREQELEKSFKSFSLFTQGFDGFPFEGYFIVQKFILPCLVEFRAHQGRKILGTTLGQYEISLLVHCWDP